MIKMSSINNMITAAVRCVKCGASYNECNCWEQCGCGWLKPYGKRCENRNCGTRQRLTFDAVFKLATKRGYRLERGSDEQGHGMKTGFILWRKGLWHQYKTLKQVVERIESGR